MTSVTIEGDEHERTATERDITRPVAITDASLVTAELPIVSDAELAPPFPDHVDEPPVAAPEAIASPPDIVPAPETGPRIIVIGDADARPRSPTTNLMGHAGEPSTPSPGSAVLPGVTPGPAVIKRRGPLVFGDSTGITLTSGDAGLAGRSPVGGSLAGGTAVDETAVAAGESRLVVIGDLDALPPEVTIDPRIKARRTQVKRSAGLRRLRAIVMIVVALAVLFGGGTVLRSYVLVVRSVVVTGTDHTPIDTIQQAVNTVAGRSMVDISLVDLRKQIEASPWVKAVDVTRDWPSTIRIDVLERRPIAFYRGSDDHGYLVDDLGLVLTLTDGQPVGFPQITGTIEPATPGTLAPDTVQAGAQVANALPPTLRPIVAAIDSRPDGVTLLVTGTRKSKILLGNADDLAAKLVTVLAFQDACPPDSYDTLDVRVPGKPAVTPAAGCKAKGKGA